MNRFTRPEMPSMMPSRSLQVLEGFFTPIPPAIDLVCFAGLMGQIIGEVATQSVMTGREHHIDLNDLLNQAKNLFEGLRNKQGVINPDHEFKIRLRSLLEVCQEFINVEEAIQNITSWMDDDNYQTE